MKFTQTFSVDAGNVGVIDEDYLKENGGLLKDPDLNKRVDVPEGKYEILFRCGNTWRGKINTKKIIETKGSLIFGDLCYLWNDHDKWMKFLDKTDYLKNGNEFFDTNDTGGDGGFKFNITINRMED
jgi:hypothetical protein